MKIKILETQRVPNAIYHQGMQYPIEEIGEGQAKTWVNNGVAEIYPKPEPKPKRKKGR